MQIQVIGSSSSGNCYILKTATGSLMLECGVNFQKIKKALGFDLRDVKACIITHEHKDHSKAVSDVMAAGIDVWMSNGTADALDLKGYRLNRIQKDGFHLIGDFTIIPFDTQHDCREPLGFLIIYRPTGETLLFATDTYYIRYKFPGINYILIECNYIPDILKANVEYGIVDEFRKNRLLTSHFSLDNVLEFIKANDMSKVKKIILMHLSDQNSDAVRMIKEIQYQSQRPTLVAEPGMIIDLVKAPF